MKYLALDYGERRVGVAVSDPGGAMAFARDFLENSGQEDLLVKITTLCEQEGIHRIILGLPLHTDGQEGERVKATRDFAELLKKTLPQIELEFFDERFTTKWATHKLREAGIKAKEQKGKKDSLAAQILLQTYLDALAR